MLWQTIAQESIVGNVHLLAKETNILFMPNKSHTYRYILFIYNER